MLKRPFWANFKSNYLAISSSEASVEQKCCVHPVTTMACNGVLYYSTSIAAAYDSPGAIRANQLHILSVTSFEALWLGVRRK